MQDFDAAFFKDFPVIIAGLDNVEARRWINSMVHELVTFEEGEEPDVPTVMIDGGTEGFLGQARVIVPFTTSCYECSMDSLPPQQTYPECTIKQTPRLPEHCISYAMRMEFDTHFKRPIDTDSPDDMKWIYEKALERAEHFGIEGVTYKLTMGVVKNIIPAIASTNALISAACTNECIKILSGCNNRLDSYMQYLG